MNYLKKKSEKPYIFNYFEKMKYVFQITTIKLLSGIVKKDEYIWVFGGNRGNTFSDNSMYFYKYILNNYLNIRPIWITNNNSTKMDVIKSGGEAYKFFFIPRLFVCY